MVQRMRDQLMFSVVSILLLFVVLRVVGVRSSVGSIVLSIALTVMLNVALTYWADSRDAREQRRGARREPMRGGGDIRWREDDRPPDQRDRPSRAHEPRSNQADSYEAEEFRRRG